GGYWFLFREVALFFPQRVQPLSIAGMFLINLFQCYDRINGHPGNYVRIAGFRLEECHPSGCLTDLSIQMGVIMTLSQVMNKIPSLTSLREKHVCAHPLQLAEEEKCDDCLLKDWQNNYQLADLDDLMIQFSFTTLFVAAFPLAPLMALINNIVEIRLEAIKMVRLERRLIPKKTNVMGIWTNVLEAIGVLAVITNGLVIGITSDFVPRLVYRYGYGPCALGEAGTHCMSGYINSSLTTAYINETNPYRFVSPEQRHLFNSNPLKICTVKDHSLTSHFWLVLAARLAFVMVFEVCLRHNSKLKFLVKREELKETLQEGKTFNNRYVCVKMILKSNRNMKYLSFSAETKKLQIS
uniref:Anoctamin n=1 Tax=Oryzias melastigma TaxID=30732 RepID=A0A3B3CS13_ORYME